jgi:hypothetical protein
MYAYLGLTEAKKIKIYINLEWSIRVLFRDFTSTSAGETDDNHDKTLSIDDIAARIRTWYSTNACLKHYGCNNLLSPVCVRIGRDTNRNPRI